MIQLELPLSERRCWCGKKEIDPEKATFVRDGIVICNNLCLRVWDKQEKQHDVV